MQTEIGRLFHTEGPMEKKARCPAKFLLIIFCYKFQPVTIFMLFVNDLQSEQRSAVGGTP